MDDINPVQFGALMAQVATLEAQVTKLQDNVEKLLELANKSRGGFWVGMTIAASFGGLGSWILSHIVLR